MRRLYKEDIKMSIKIAITNEKGGCGKTMSTVNISAILAERGYRVLLVDADPQGYSTMYYGLYDPSLPSLFEVMFFGENPEQAISTTAFGVDVLRSSTALMDAEELLDQRKLNGLRYNDLFVNALSALESRYDYILIDCPPQGYKLLENIQLYARFLLIPMIADEFALHSLRLKAEKIIEIRRTVNPQLRLLGGLIVMDERNKTTGIYREALQSQDILPVFRATVRKNRTPASRAMSRLRPNLSIWQKKTRMRLTTRKKASAILPIRSKNSACSTRLVWSSTTAGTRSFRANAGIKQSHNICTGKRSPAVYLRAYPPGARSSCCI